MNSNESKNFFYKTILENSKVFLTEIPFKENRSLSLNESIQSENDQISIKSNSDNLHQDLIFKRNDCHQRLSLCSRKKLSLLSFQEQVIIIILSFINKS